MPQVGGQHSHNGGCSCHQFQEADAHLMGGAESRYESQYGAMNGSRLSLFCPGATTAQYAPDLLLEPTHLDVTLHVDLDQQCLVVDEVITVRCNIGSKGNAYSITLDGIGFQHLHASRVNTSISMNSAPTTPRKESGGSKSPTDFIDKLAPLNDKPSAGRSLFGFLRGSNERGPGHVSPSRASAQPTTSNQAPPPPPPPEDVRDNTSFYCTYDGRKITLSWVGPEAFQGGQAGVTEKVRLIYLVDKPVTGLNFTKPPTEVEIEMIEQQQKPLVTSSYKKNDKTEKKVHIAAPIARVSPFHSSRPLLAFTDHETERARYWLATIDQPCVRPTSKFTFVIKAGLAALANGELLPTASLDTPIPHWPLSLFNPPITTPKAPIWPKTLFIWNNPYPTASYLACFAVGQLHYIEAIPPRHMQAHYQQEQNASSSSSHPRSGAGLLKTSGNGATSSGSSGGGASHGHKRTLSSDSGKTVLASSVNSLPTPTVFTPTDPPSATLSARSGSQRLASINEILEGTSSFSTAISSAHSDINSTTIGYQLSPSEALALTKADLAHHKKTAKKREEADWILKDIPMRYYTPRNVPLTTVQLMLGRTPEIMKWLQARFGLPFPYPVKYYQFVAPELPSAMENITLTTWGSDYLLNPVWALEYGASTESINVHEMAHSYFGNSVGVKFWDHAWLKEGWANYSECLWQEDKYGPDAMAYMIWRNGKLYMKECENLYTRPIVTNRYDSSWDLYDQHLYRGGSRRIHSLRCILGDEVFWPAVTDYLRTFSGRLVETDDFRKTLEKHSHRNLLPFFRQWIHAPGYPKITATYEYSPTRQQISINAKQTQADDKRGIGLFAMSIPIDIAYAAPVNSSVTSSSGSSSSTTTGATYGQPAHMSSSSKIKWIKTAIVFTESSSEAHMTINVPSPPLQIIFDKKQSYVFSLAMDPGFSVLRTMALHCWSIPHRIWAAQGLLERGSPQELEVISEMLSHREQHWGVIADIACALAKPHRAQFAANVLCKLLLAPFTHPAQHPRALMSIALALGQIQDPVIRTSIHQFLAIKKYSNICRIDEREIRSISSWNSLTELAEKARKEHRRTASIATPQSSSGQGRYSSDSLGSDSEDSDTGFAQVSVSSSTKKDDTSVNLDITIPYKTHGRLMEALAAQGDVADEALIVEQAERTRYGWLGITRSSALMALAEYGTQSAFDYILDATRVSEHQHLKARTSAVIALAHCVVRAKLNPPMLTRAIHTFHLLLHDSTYAVRFAAVHALFKLIPQMGPSSGADSLAQIQHVRKSFSNQDRMWLKRKRKLVRGEGKIHNKASARAAAVQSTSSSSGTLGTPGGPVNIVAPPAPSMDDFMALKSELNALKTRVTQIEKSLEDSEGENQ